MLWPIIVLLWYQRPPDCQLTTSERDTIAHYLSWSHAKQGLSPKQNTDKSNWEGLRNEADLYLNVPTRTGNGFTMNTILIVNRNLIPMVSEWSWNPESITFGFEYYIAQNNLPRKGSCVVGLPDRLANWQPSPPGTEKDAVIERMRTEVRRIVGGDGSWTVDVSDFHVDDPRVDAVLKEDRTGQHRYGTFSMSRFQAPFVVFIPLMATDIGRIRPEAFVGTNPLRFRLASNQ